LSLCAGWAATAAADNDFNSLDCITKPLGWTFRTDDPFIVNYGSANGSYPVVTSGVKVEELSTQAPAVTLVLGLIFSSLAVVAFVYDLTIDSLGKRRISIVPMISTALIVVCTCYPHLTMLES